MGHNAVELERVSKRYLLGEHHGSSGSLRETASDAVRRLVRGRGLAPRDELWSLRDVTLEVGEGETLGIIGRNGAGKSTLLKVLTRITEPSSGVARTRGRVGSLLEVGVGFHPELSGRENVFLNGALLGMSRREITARFDDIVDFSGVGRFLDTPVKRYSSGMYLRLAFAVAAHLEAEIMVVDEVLAVGDAEFQRKCLGKMSSLERDGRTVLFVSHNLDAITRLCPTSLWLDKGRVRAWGPTAEVVDAYLAAGFGPDPRKAYAADPGGPVAVEGMTVLDARGNVAAALERDEPWTVEVRFTVRERVPGLDMTVFAHTQRGLRVLEEAWSETEPDDRGAPGSYVTRVTIPPVLVAGDYVLGLWLGSPYETLLYEEEALHFRLEGSVRGRTDRVVQLGVPWDVRRAPGEAAGP